MEQITTVQELNNLITLHKKVCVYFYNSSDSSGFLADYSDLQKSKYEGYYYVTCSDPNCELVAYDNYDVDLPQVAVFDIGEYSENKRNGVTKRFYMELGILESDDISIAKFKKLIKHCK